MKEATVTCFSHKQQLQYDAAQQKAPFCKSRKMATTLGLPLCGQKSIKFYPA
jgi:hypothetical protein